MKKRFGPTTAIFLVVLVGILVVVSMQTNPPPPGPPTPPPAPAAAAASAGHTYARPPMPPNVPPSVKALKPLPPNPEAISIGDQYWHTGEMGGKGVKVREDKMKKDELAWKAAVAARNASGADMHQPTLKQVPVTPMTPKMK